MKMVKIQSGLGKVGISSRADEESPEEIVVNRSRKKVLVILAGSIHECEFDLTSLLLNSLALQPGDELILFAFHYLLSTDSHHHHHHPNSKSNFINFSALTATALRILGSSSGSKQEEDEERGKMIEDNQIKEFNRSTRKRNIEDELTRRKQEYQNNPAFIHIHNSCKLRKIKLGVEMQVGSSRKAAAVSSAKRLEATWIVLDREMKKDKQYFMDRLSCGIWSMKRSNAIIKIRDPTPHGVSYDEMIPSYSWEALSTPSSTPASMETSFRSRVRGTTSNTKLNRAIAENPTSQDTKCHLNSHKETCKTLKHDIMQSEGPDKNQMEKESDYSICSVCHNKRPKFGSPKDFFTYLELYKATGGFSRRNFLSEGGFGSVYKGVLQNGVKIAVKQLKAASLQGEKEFRSEVRVLSQARHQNLVVLLGSCDMRSRKLLVYEYICNGSLDEHLSGGSREPLNWEQRIKIAYGAAKGLAYLHSQNIVHRDVRPGNILITHDHESLLGDFGLAKAQQDEIHSSDTRVVGTLGYMAPEYAESGRMSTKTDVYSFGVVLLQLITGLRTTDEIPGGKSLVGWAKPLLEAKNYPDLIDKRILDSHDVHQLFWMVLVAENCLKTNPDNRYTMEQVVEHLNSIKEGNRNCLNC